MSILPQLASSQGRKDEVPNQQLAAAIVASQDQGAVKELVEHLSDKKAIQNDCIKVLYEIGEHNPQLIAPYIQNFVALLSSKNNRLQWGGMTALATLTTLRPAEIFQHLPEILQRADSGSVITRDQAVNILIALCTFPEYHQTCFLLLIEQMHQSPVNQLPMYAERALPVIAQEDKAAFVKVLASRLPDIDKDSKRLRIEKVIRKLR